MSFDQNFARELAQFDGIGQAALVRNGDVTARELIQGAIDRIEEADLAINAVVHRRFEEALDEAERNTAGRGAPFAGVPLLLKDEGCAQAGVPQTMGNAALKEIRHTPEVDDLLGRRFRESGLITVGVTNMPEFGQLADTQPLAFGPTRNPWNLSHSVGGSSGGAAAAVAAGFVPIAHGADGGGSIRQPAAWCGVFGLKPSRGRMPTPIRSVDNIWSVPGVITRTVRDTAGVLDALNGALTGDLYGLPRPHVPYLESLGRPTRSLRVGLLTEGPGGLVVSAECVRGVEQAGEFLTHAGHLVEMAHPSAFLEPTPDELFPLDRDEDIWLFDDLSQRLRRPVGESDVEPFMWWRHNESRPASAQDLRNALGWQVSRAARMLEWWDEGFDLLVTPVSDRPSELLADLAEQSPPQIHLTERRHVTFLEPINASGQPAVTVPIRWTDDDIPVGVQIVAAKGADGLLLRVAAQLEEAVDWSTRTPKLSIGPSASPQTN